MMPSVDGNTKKLVLDGNLSKEKVLSEIDQFIEQAEKEDRSVFVSQLKRCFDSTAPDFVKQTIFFLILAGLKCDTCNGRCCTSPPHKKKLGYIALMPSEYNVLKAKGIAMQITMRHRDGRELPSMSYPCVFLANGRCSVYEDRPLICRMYPVQFNEEGLAIDSSCPEGIRILKRYQELLVDTTALVRPADARRAISVPASVWSG